MSGCLSSLLLHHLMVIFLGSLTEIHAFLWLLERGKQQHVFQKPTLICLFLTWEIFCWSCCRVLIIISAKASVSSCVRLEKDHSLLLQWCMYVFIYLFWQWEPTWTVFTGYCTISHDFFFFFLNIYRYFPDCSLSEHKIPLGSIR